MDGTTGKPDGVGSHIWLHYTTQFTAGGSTHTIEMDIPIPIGASADLRTRLLQEAEASMRQLTSLVGTRFIASNIGASAEPAVGVPLSIPSRPSSTDRPKPSPSVYPASTATPAPQGRGQSGHGNSGASPSVSPPQGRDTSGSAASPSAQDTTRRDAVNRAPEESKEVVVPPTRPNIGASMPSAPGMMGGISGNLTIPQFVQFLKENMGGMSARQAMDLLKVKTLNGLNLREALEQLQQIVANDATIPPTDQKGIGAAPPAQFIAPNRSEARVPPQGRDQLGPNTSSPPPPIPIRPPANPPSASADQAARNPAGIKEITNAVVRDMPPSYAFDEEIDLDLDEVEGEEMEYIPELTDQERTIAELVINRLKEARGSSPASEARIKVVHNVVDSQIGEEQLQELIEGVWGVTTLKKLKNDQVEALISWAKEDDFVSELEMVLILLQENQYARSDR